MNCVDVLGLVRVQVCYWLRVFRLARCEVACWDQRARRVPEGTLREHALAKLAGEGLNAEGAALFALLAPARARGRMVRLLVAFQVLYDYLDAVNEQPMFAGLRSGLQMHRALVDAVLPERPMSEVYLDPSEPGDGGYIHSLVSECRRVVRMLPGAAPSASVLERAAQRCAEAQSRTHASLVCGESPLIEWSLHATQHGDEPWWELGAAGVSSLAIHALLAAAADPASTAEDAERLEEAYFPSICALSTLLDSLADYYQDARTANHSFIAHYRDADHAAERLVAIAARAGERVTTLRDGRTHAIILAGIVAYYLSSPSTREGFPATAAETLTRHAGPVAAPMLAAMRVRRHIHRRASENRRAREQCGPTRLVVSHAATLGAPGERARGPR
jgi:tetraprenyl-beta-curcumene synthase